MAGASGTRRGAAGATSLLMAVTVVAGAGIGVGLQQAGVLGGGPTTVEVALDAVAVVDCPDGAEVGELHRGDRVFATGRDANAEWLEVRDPADLGAGVWVRAQHVLPDAAVSDLEVRACGDAASVATTTTAPAGAPPPAAAPTPGPTRAGGTAPADTTGPTITGVSASPPAIETLDSGGGGACPVNTAIVAVSASDPSGISSVAVTWTAGSASGTAAPQGGGYRVGPIPYQSGSPIDQPVVLSITVRDGAGNATSTTNNGALRYSFCFT